MMMCIGKALNGWIDMDREEKIKEVCERLLYEHKELAKFIGGFNPKPCDCYYCQIAREVVTPFSKSVMKRLKVQKGDKGFIKS